MERERISIEISKKYNLPNNMTARDFNDWMDLNSTIASREYAGFPCESWKDQRFDIINRYYIKNNK